MQVQLKWIRYVVGYVFIVSGAVKLLVPGFKDLFLSLGFSFPYVTLFLLAMVEITCGALIIARMYVKYAAIPLIVVMVGALYIVKFQVFINEGILQFLFESRLDVVMLILLFVLWHRSELTNT